MAIEVWCTRCGSADLDLGPMPRGDEPVHCRSCGEWFTFGELERAALAKIETRRVPRMS